MSKKTNGKVLNLILCGLCTAMLAGCGTGTGSEPPAAATEKQELSSEKQLSSEMQQAEESLLSDWLNYSSQVKEQLQQIGLCVIGQEADFYPLRPGEMIYGTASRTYLEDLSQKKQEELEGTLSVLDVTCGMTLEELTALEILKEGWYLEVQEDGHQFYLAWYLDREDGQWKQLHFAEDDIENHSSVILVLFDLEEVDGVETVSGMFCECF